MPVRTSLCRTDCCYFDPYSESENRIALSFVQRPEDVVEARRLIGNRAHVLVKVEKPAALHRIDEIVAAADAAMVALGDLGVEMPPEEVPIAQKTIIRTCRNAGKPVIVATQMLESMV